MAKKNKISDDSDLQYPIADKDFSDQIINHSRSMISIINRDYVYEKVNETFCKAHKTDPLSVVGRSLEDVWGTTAFQNNIKENIDLCFSGKTISYEACFSTAKLGNRHFEVIFRPLSVESGKITHLLAETFDIDDLRRSEKVALEKEDELRAFETNLPIGYLRCDLEGKIIHANRSFLRILECEEESSVKGRNLKDFYLEEVLFEIHKDQLIEGSTKSFGRVALKNCRGTEIHCRISGYPYGFESGSPTFIDFAIEDSSRELMLENRLLQAQKLETIGALAGGIAHDFNNILATISGYSEMLIEDLHRNSEQIEKITRIQNAVLKAQSITKQILTFSRQLEQDKVPVSVSEVLMETIGFVNSSIPQNITVKSRVTAKKANVLADPTQLFRVFLNLMTNAVQSMEVSGGTLSVDLDVVKGKFVRHELNKDIVADEYVLVTFKDTGKGMEPSLAARIFEPFFTTREVGKGTGLGLSVTHGIITEMEGEILVSSKKEEGSVFYVYLPVSQIYPDSQGKKEGNKKILFITGNKYESRILSLALENAGYELIYISDRRNMIRVMSLIDERPDLIIYMSDSKQIQQEDLVGVFRRLKIFTPCILITDPSQEIFEEKLLNSGIIKQHLIKPVSLKEIRNAIQVSLK